MTKLPHDKHLMRAIADIAIWLEFSDDDVIDPDAAVPDCPRPSV